MMNCSIPTIVPPSPTTTAVIATTVKKPKRPLSAYNLFYRFKREKIVAAAKAGNDSPNDIINLVMSVPGLEDYLPESLAATMTSSQIDELSRSEIRSELLTNLSPNETRKRTHRKSQGAMSFLEMNKHMVCSWKSIDEETRSVFEELAEIGRRVYRKRVAEYQEITNSPGASPSCSSSSPKKKLKTSNGSSSAMNMSMVAPPPLYSKVNTTPAIGRSFAMSHAVDTPSSHDNKWGSVVVDEIDMSLPKTTNTSFNFGGSALASRRVSVETTSSSFGYYDNGVLCVTTPMQFPEKVASTHPSTRQQQELLVDFPLARCVSNGSELLMNFPPSSPNNYYRPTFIKEEANSPNDASMDFDTLEFDEPPEQFKHMFDIEDEMNMSMDCSDNDYPPFVKRDEKQSHHLHSQQHVNHNIEPSADDFLKLIHDLDEGLPFSPMAMAA